MFRMKNQDKLYHLAAGFVIAGSLAWFSVFIALCAVTAAAIGKEVWDSQGNGTCDANDITATLVGGLLAVAFTVSLLQ